MTKEELALMLNGREYLSEITKEEELAAKQNGLVAIFGASDDLCELRGAIHDEVGAYDGGTFWIKKDGSLFPKVESKDEHVLAKYGVSLAALRARYAQVEALWCSCAMNAGLWDYSWIYKTELPHAPFDVMEDGKKFCRGIVIDLKDVA